jgi:hypothetical protein
MLSPKARRPDILVQMICGPVLARSGIRAVREIGRYGAATALLELVGLAVGKHWTRH